MGLHYTERRYYDNEKQDADFKNSSEELKQEYKKLARKMHPDKEGGDTKLFQKLSQLYNILTEKFI
jgi:DnaJ-class molecular chaperone